MLGTILTRTSIIGIETIYNVVKHIKKGAK